MHIVVHLHNNNYTFIASRYSRYTYLRIDEKCFIYTYIYLCMWRHTNTILEFSYYYNHQIAFLFYNILGFYQIRIEYFITFDVI